MGWGSRAVGVGGVGSEVGEYVLWGGGVWPVGGG